MDIHEAIRENKVQTRGGARARIICRDAQGHGHPIVALVTVNDSTEYVLGYGSIHNEDKAMEPKDKLGVSFETIKAALHDKEDKLKARKKAVDTRICAIQEELSTAEDERDVFIEELAAIDEHLNRLTDADNFLVESLK